MKIHQYAARLALLLCSALLAGCGSGTGPGAIPVKSSGIVMLKITFPPAPTRSLSPGAIPTGTNAIKVALVDPNATGASALLAQPQIVARPVGSNTVTVTFRQMRAGAIRVQATAYSDIAAATPPLASGTVDGVVASDQTTSISVPLTLQVGTVSVSPTSLQLSAPASTATSRAALIAARGRAVVAASVLTATIQDVNGMALSGLPVTWTSDKPAVAAVNQDPTNPLRATVTPLSPGTAIVTVTETNSGKSASCTVTVLGPATVSISPSSITLPQGGSTTFSATVANSSNTAVTYSVLETIGGSITSTGVYTAPTHGGTFHVRAVSSANPSSAATATVYVPSGFAATGSMSKGHFTHTATVLLDGRVLIVGGADETGTTTSSAEIFDFNTNRFTVTGSLNKRRAAHTATLLPSGKVLIAGGFNETDGQIAAPELYDPTQGTFTPSTGTMVSARALHTATALNNGQVLLAGGAVGGKSTSSAELYDPVTDRFRAVSGMTQPRDQHAAALLADGTVALFAGEQLDATGPTVLVHPLSSVEIFSPGSSSFSSGGSLTTARSALTASLLPNGRVLLAGGDNTSNNVIGTAEIWDPVTKSVPASSIIPMVSPRSGHAAAVLQNGQVLLTGGASNLLPDVNTAEVFDPVDSRFVPAGSMAQARRQHTATLIPGAGVVLVAGGAVPNATGTAPVGLKSAEIYDPNPVVFVVVPRSRP